MVCDMELRHFLEKLEVSGSFFVSLCFRVCLKIIPAICTPHFAVYFTRIRLP